MSTVSGSPATGAPAAARTEIRARPDIAAGTTILRRRVIALGLPLSLLAFWLVVRMEQTDQTGLPTGLALYYHVVAILLALVGGNRLLGRLAPGVRAASPAELLCLFSMMAVASAFASWEMLGTVIPSLAYPVHWGATRPDRLRAAEEATRRLPFWAILRDAPTAAQLFRGHRPWEPGLLLGWWPALAAWGGLLVVGQVMAGAACRLLYHRWAHAERLAFPLVALPLEIVRPAGGARGLASHRLFWLGFVLVCALDLVNGLHQLYPSIPEINVKVRMFNTDATTPAWQAVGMWPVTFHPLVIGLAFLLPTDLLFSCWFFYLVGKLQLYAAGAVNRAEGSPYVMGGNFPGLNEQNAGAFFVLGLAVLWGARGHLAAVWRDAAAPGSGGGARRDLRLLAAGALVWAGALLWLGLPPLLVPPFLLLAGVLAIVVTRLRAEMGLPVHNLHWQGPEELLGVGIGSAALGGGAVTALASVHGLLRSQQGHVMPHLMEGIYLADRSGNGSREVLRRYGSALLLAGCAAALVGPWIFVRTVSGMGLEQTPGGYNPFPTEGWERVAAWVSQPKPPDLRAVALMVTGGFVTLGLVLLRLHWVGSPFHPLGYAISGGWGLGMIATPLFLAWLVKVLLLRYGGLGAYRAALPLAFGVLLGEFVMGTFWALVSVGLGQPTYRIWLF